MEELRAAIQVCARGPHRVGGQAGPGSRRGGWRVEEVAGEGGKWRVAAACAQCDGVRTRLSMRAVMIPCRWARRAPAAGWNSPSGTAVW